MQRYQSYRYRCDHCGKTSGSGGHMKRHEANCTANPQRSCGFCKSVGGGPRPMPELIAALSDGGTAGLAALRELCSGCPGCMLAAIRQSGLQGACIGPERPEYVSFDFRLAKLEWWNRANEAALQLEYR